MAGPLDELGEDPGALFRELVEWSTRPSFGSHSKRELELKLFELLYRARLAEGPVSVARIAEELTTTRARARSLLLEVRNRGRGLEIAKRAAEELGGRLSFEIDGDSAVATLDLPAA